MNTKYWIASVLAVGLVAGGASMAIANQGGKNRPSFEMLDANKDGKLTQAEMDAHKTAAFAKADTNGDGMLSSEEMLARAQTKSSDRMAKRVTRMIEHMDTDKDGMLSAGEMQGAKRGKGMFARVDADNDGAITAEEFAAHKPRRGKHHGQRDQSWKQNTKPVTE